MKDLAAPELQVVRAILARAATITGAQPFRYRFSSAGDPCLRALVYDAQDADDGKPPVRAPGKLKWLLSAACGTAVGDKLEAAARTLGMETQKAHEFDTGAVKVRGSSDIATEQCVFDCKLVGEKSWAKIEKRPKPEHVLQVNGYAVENDSPRWALIYVRAVTIFDDSDDLEIRVHPGDADRDLAQQLCSTWERVETHRKLRTLPERIFAANPTGWPCAWCRHLERCAPTKMEDDNA